MRGLCSLTIEQRSRIASAIIIPKFLYVGRHAWPGTGTVKRINGLIKNYVWHDFFGVIEGRRTTWLAEAVARLPRKKFGLGIPDLRAELLAMAAVTVLRWGSKASIKDQALGDFLFQPTKLPVTRYITPGFSTTFLLGFRAGKTLWKVEATLIKHSEMEEVSAEHKTHVVELYVQVEEATIGQCTSQSGGHVETDLRLLIGSRTSNMRRFCVGVHGKCCTEWLPYATLWHLSLLNADGVQQTLKHLSFGRAEFQLRHLLTWTMDISGIIIWHIHLFVPDEDLRLLIILLVTNYPELLYQRSTTPELRIRAHPLDHVITAQVLAPFAQEETATIAVSTDNFISSTTLTGGLTTGSGF
ncbi:unnamed protein product [Peronospora destructor]|uniref:Uncharacterized protein n=1 Tax=Peronospora destructor TaxID=86335 RepID=A0AAV0TNK0_9STRA|nr:unnamed protein product [Peronospora destructor]